MNSQNTDHTTLVMGVVTIFLSKVPLLYEYQKYGDGVHSSFNVTQEEEKNQLQYDNINIKYWISRIHQAFLHVQDFLCLQHKHSGSVYTPSFSIYF